MLQNLSSSAVVIGALRVKTNVTHANMSKYIHIPIHRWLPLQVDGSAATCMKSVEFTPDLVAANCHSSLYNILLVITAAFCR